MPRRVTTTQILPASHSSESHGKSSQLSPDVVLQVPRLWHQAQGGEGGPAARQDNKSHKLLGGLTQWRVENDAV